MAFLLKNSVASHFSSQSQTAKNDSLNLSRRQFHVEPGPREKALLAVDPSLKRFKSPKKGVLAMKRIGDVLTVVVVAGTLLCFCSKVLGCCYEIYVKAVMREEARGQTKA